MKRTDVAFHAQRAIQELSFDTFKSVKSQEITLPPSLTMRLPQDYVNYVKLSWSDSSGIERPLYPTRHTSNPIPILQNSDGEYALTAIGTITETSDTITLDDEYKNILVGMIVSGPNVPVGSIVASTANASSITTITITNANGVAAEATYTGDETLTFTPTDGSLILEEESVYVLENVTWADDEDKITQSPNTDVSNIKVGMLVSHDFFPEGTTVIDVNGAVITTSEPSTEASTSTTNEVTFISTPNDSSTWNSYSSETSTTDDANAYNYDTDIYDFNMGQRYGLEPSHAQSNGTYYIDNLTGLIHFSSNVSGKNIVLRYISDGLGTDDEMQVHKFAEEAMYKWIAYAILSTRMNVPEYIVNRFKREKFTTTRTAKLRLSNLKIEELLHILRGKAKHIKH